MENRSLELIQAWVKLSSILKNTRFTKELPYNEAVVMLQLYQAGSKPSSIRQITANTGMLKSQVNRTINSLEEKGLLVRCASEGDRRIGYVRCVAERLDTFLQVHNRSMEIANSITQIIGADDADTFIRIVEKLAQSGYHL